MGKKLLLSLSLILLLALSLSTSLNMNPASVSAAEYPAVMVVPDKIVDSTLTPGTNFTVSIYTDYTGEDVWGWQFTLEYNPNVLHGGINTTDTWTGDGEKKSFIATVTPVARELETVYVNEALLPRIEKITDTETGNGQWTEFTTSKTPIVPGSEFVYVNEALLPRIEKIIDSWKGDGATTEFTTSKTPIVPESEFVYVKDKLMTRDENYTINYDTGVITFIMEAPADKVEVKAVYEYENYTINYELGKINFAEAPAYDVEVKVVYEYENYTINYELGKINFAEAPAAGVEVKAIYFGNGVVNGDLITGQLAMFYPGTFDNDAGTLSLTSNSFMYDFDNKIYPTTKGPGILANVTFTVVGVGTSDITLGGETQLKAPTYDIVDGVTDPDQLGHGYFDNTAPPEVHDVAVTSVTPTPTSVLVGDTVSIDVAILNEGDFSENVDVYAYADTDTATIGNEVVLGPTTVSDLAPGDSATVPFSWVTEAEGTYWISGEAVITVDDHPNDNLLTADETVTVLPVLVVGWIEGTVTDAELVAIEGATVTANGYSTTTDASGYYNIEVPAPETYTVTASATGYEVASQPGVAVASGETVTLNFALTPIVGGDVAVTSITLSCLRAGVPAWPADNGIYTTWGKNIDVTVVVKNLGAEPATFDVTALYTNATGDFVIDTTTVVGLGSNVEEVVTFSWNFSNLALGNYTISARAMLDGDINPENDIGIFGTITNRMPGDANGNGVVNIADAAIIGKGWQQGPGDSYYESEGYAADFNWNGILNIADAAVVGKNWQKTTDAY